MAMPVCPLCLSLAVGRKAAVPGMPWKQWPACLMSAADTLVCRDVVVPGQSDPLHSKVVDSMYGAMQVIEFFRHTYPNTMTFVREVDEWRAYLGRFGISGRLQV